MIISFYEITVCQHHDCCSNVCSDVALSSYVICLMRWITCLPDFFSCLTRTVCFISCCSISLTDNCTVTCRAFFRLYCWRVFWLRFFLAGEFGCCWVTAESGVDCGAYDIDGTACWVNEIDNDNLDLAAVTLSSLVLNLSIIASIWLVSSVIITCRAFIVTGISAIWVIGILLRLIGISLNNRMA